MRKIGVSIGLCTVLLFSALFTAPIVHGQGNDIQVVVDTVRNLEHTADDGKGSVKGDSAGSNVMQDVSTVNICGVKIGRGNGVKNLQANGDGFQVVRVKTLESFINLVGANYRDLVTSEFADAKGYSDGSGKVYALHKTFDLGCGEPFELDVYDVKSSNYLKTIININLVGIKNTSDSEEGPDANNRDYKMSDSVCKVDDNGNNVPPFANGSGSSDKIEVAQKTVSLPYDFGCAGRYHVTYTDYYTDGSSSTPKDEYITIPKATILTQPRPQNPQQSTLRISK
jgi:hypothetical protein